MYRKRYHEKLKYYQETDTGSKVIEEKWIKFKNTHKRRQKSCGIPEYRNDGQKSGQSSYKREDFFLFL